jgi:hypothetical protein
LFATNKNRDTYSHLGFSYIVFTIRTELYLYNLELLVQPGLVRMYYGFSEPIRRSEEGVRSHESIMQVGSAPEAEADGRGTEPSEVCRLWYGFGGRGEAWNAIEIRLHSY